MADPAKRCALLPKENSEILDSIPAKVTNLERMMGVINTRRKMEELQTVRVALASFQPISKSCIQKPFIKTLNFHHTLTQLLSKAKRVYRICKFIKAFINSFKYTIHHIFHKPSLLPMLSFHR
ncbi:hypothetical protein AQUCO_06000066v1 [Aquilegia coerulea]|uniref:Uncharacterized protein n=1 Tax=Aquilegia coerulea TaxID=218851 RepID=A0A2G5CDU8_AQUCA|nr:hypothetical protein AQUCO_06000066v1 [Aquilegia coerulea]